VFSLDGPIGSKEREKTNGRSIWGGGGGGVLFGGGCLVKEEEWLIVTAVRALRPFNGEGKRDLGVCSIRKRKSFLIRKSSKGRKEERPCTAVLLEGEGTHLISGKACKLVYFKEERKGVAEPDKRVRRKCIHAKKTGGKKGPPVC